MSNDLDFSFLDKSVINPLRTQEGLNSKAFRTLDWDDASPETNWIRVQYTYELMRDNLHGESVFPGAVAAIIRSRAWEGYEFRGKIIKKTSFREFVESKPPEGLGVTIEELVRLCRNHTAVVEGIDQILKSESNHNGARKDLKIEDSAKKYSPTTSLQRSLRQLRNIAETDKNAAKLRVKVLQGEMSVSRALMELGTRKKRYAIEATPDAIIQFAKKHLSAAQRKKLIDALR